MSPVDTINQIRGSIANETARTGMYPEVIFITPEQYRELASHGCDTCKLDRVRLVVSSHRS